MGRDPITEASASLEGVLPIDGGTLRVLDGPDVGRTERIARAPVTVGTDASCDLVMTDTKVSRRHCEISVDPRGFRVRDLSSRNGTIFEGARIADVFVPVGAIVKIGSSHLVLSAGNDRAPREVSARTSFGELVGRSVAMRQAYALLERAAANDITVFIGGETGTGKELAARAIHANGSRARAPFVVLDCGAVAPTLIMDELFGHARGAFTGANEARMGVFEQANGGTVFLDEVGELPVTVQAALLRVCDRGEIVRVGSTGSIRVDVRIIAATHRDLAAETLQGRFREDLYYRLQVLPIQLPPLRARREDLPDLCARILERLGVPNHGRIEGPPLALLAQHSWPGNVRELASTLGRAVALAGPRPFLELPIDIDRSAVPAGVSQSDAFHAQRQQMIADFERRYLEELMSQHENSVRSAARASGIDRTQLRRLLRRYGMM